MDGYFDDPKSIIESWELYVLWVNKKTIKNEPAFKLTNIHHRLPMFCIHTGFWSVFSFFLNNNKETNALTLSRDYLTLSNDGRPTRKLYSSRHSSWVEAAWVCQDQGKLQYYWSNRPRIKDQTAGSNQTSLSIEYRDFYITIRYIQRSNSCWLDLYLKEDWRTDCCF